MGRGKPLTHIEKDPILDYSENNPSANAIAKRMGRSWNVVNNFLPNPAAYGSKKSTGRPKMLGVVAECRL
ncbi:hypothetical protein F441_20658 [Phytophthora nicotianae CJ01A1]|uniref:Tc3 transposase DNA binding domain-containing protein n=1 Tax=Phytophthora nicotianae CJ01A1 TaxID=1317063 RepID=W2VVE4_PHYNI|nr:hypothetical protein F441_20658 [Phytophthora nicotianae CJ01A1]